jgi:hypothetical protein
MPATQTTSTVVAVRKPIPFGILFSTATTLVRRRSVGVLAAEISHDVDDLGAGCSSAYTVVGANREHLFADVFEVCGNGRPLPDATDMVSGIPEIDGVYASLMILTDPFDLPAVPIQADGRQVGHAHVVGPFHAWVLTRLLDRLEQDGYPCSWTIDQPGPRGGYTPWADNLDDLFTTVGDPMTWTEVTR